MTSKMQELPRWDVSNIFPGIESHEFEAAYQEAKLKLDTLEKFMQVNQISRDNQHPAEDYLEISAKISELIEQLSEAFRLVHTLNNYVYCFITTDSFDVIAARQYSKVQSQLVRLLQAEKVISGWLGSLESMLDTVINQLPKAQAHAFYLRENATQSKYLMSDPEELLANQLSLSGIRAWGKLQGTVTSQLSIDFALDGESKAYPLAALQNIRRYNADPLIRQKAFQAEIQALSNVKEPLAACLNGVAGYNIVVFRGQQREDALHHSLDTARIDRSTLEAMLTAIQDAYPFFRTYLQTKAKRFNKSSLPWWDLFAPVGKIPQHYSWRGAREFILDNFNNFSPELASFANKAFENNWIDAQPREGKRGGAFCVRIPSAEEPRVLCNFDGSLDQVSTIAHELGHAFHIECQRGKDYLQYKTPMTLAETASIFCETLVMDAALERTNHSEEQLFILDTMLTGDTQVIVDITSRFLFEREVYERRAENELSAGDFCEIMTRTQKATYGSGLDEQHLHPYMWAWKPHYYRSDIAFYNYPYAFGLLFSVGLYAIYKQRGSQFVPQLQDLLASTGQADAAQLASRFDIDIRSIDFWRDSLEIIEKRIHKYQQL